MPALDFKSKTLKNARDLGGTPVSGNRTVKMGMLIRSSALSDASERDIERLRAHYDLGLVIDLRSQDEVKKGQDPMFLLPGTTYVNIPLSQGNAVGIERKGGLAETLAMVRMIEHDPMGMMETMYVNIVDGAHGQDALRQVFGLLLGEGDRCTLWHCTAGKDRAGITTAIVLLALGATRETVMQDYLLTNEFMAHYERIQRRQLALAPKGVKDNIHIINEANPAFLSAALDTIDNDYDGIEAYLLNQIGLSRDELATLRDFYTE